jgi:predicted signal transduction protein with EAL and GGDEF domain
MSLIRQLRLLVIAVTITACTGSLLTTLWADKLYLESQLEVKNRDNAAALAISLSQQGGDLTSMQLLVAAQFDTGHYHSVRLTDINGRPMFELTSDAAPQSAPAWFTRLLPLESRPGVAQVSNGWNRIGTLEVVSHTAFAYGPLWNNTYRLLLMLALVGLIAGWIGTRILGCTRDPLARLIRQAQALSERRFVKSAVSPIPELSALTHAMNSMVDRLQSQFNEHAATVESLRIAATTDSSSGLPNRSHFINLLKEKTASSGSSGQFVLVRIRNLIELNQTLGQQKTDSAIRGLAGELNRLTAGNDAAIAGRLNGSDFAMYLPDLTATEPALRDLATQLRNALDVDHGSIQLAFSGSALETDTTPGRVFARADATLAIAENTPDGLAFATESITGAAAGGQDAWLADLRDTVSRRQIRIAWEPVISTNGSELARHAVIHAAWGQSDVFHSQTSWMPFAIRTGTISAIEEIAMELVTGDAGNFPHLKILDLSADTLKNATVVAHLVDMLQRHPGIAGQLCINLPESVVFADADFGRDISRTLRKAGARTGLYESGPCFTRMPVITEMQLDHIRIADGLLAELTETGASMAYVAGVISIARGAGIRCFLPFLDKKDMPALVQELGADGWINGSAR